MMETEKLKQLEQSKKLYELASQRTSEALKSKIEVAKALRIRKTTDMMFMRPGQDEYQGRYGYISAMFWATVRNDQAAAKTAFNGKPFISIVPTNETPSENAEAMQKVADWNIIDTGHKHSVNGGIDSMCQHGTTFLKNRFRVRNRQFSVPVPGLTGQTLSALVEKGVGNDYTEEINPQNYLQDTSALGNDFFVDGCKWVCELNRFYINDLQNLLNHDGAIVENVKHAIKKAKENKAGSGQGNSYSQQTMEGASVDTYRSAIVFEMYGLFQIEGNEDDSRYFYCLCCEDTQEILLIEEVIDHPYTIIRAIGRKDCYLGRANAESVGNIQLLDSFIINKGLENLMINMQRYFFYLKDLFNPADIQYEPNGTFIPTRHDKYGYQSINQVIQEFSGKSVNVEEMRGFLALMNDQRQLATSQSDSYNYAFKGSTSSGAVPGAYNATSAQIIENNRSIPSNDMFNNMATGFEAHWQKKIASLQVNLEDYALVRVTGGNPEVIRKFMIMGSFDAYIKTCLTTNKLFKYNTLRDVYGFLAQVIPLAGPTGQIADFNWRQLISSAMELGEIPDREKILSKTMPVPSVTTQLPAPQAGQPAPAPVAAAA